MVVMESPVNVAPKAEVLLSVRDLRVDFFTHEGVITALNSVNLTVRRGEMSALVGESGSGKSVLAWTLLGLTRPPGKVTRGEILWRAEDVLAMSRRRISEVRGKEIGLIVSNPRSHLHPLTRVGRQIEAVRFGGDRSRAAREVTLKALRDVEMADPMRVYRAYPHELSGGMAQRVLIAMALINSPQLVIADDATSALDVTVQRQVLDLMTSLIRQRQAAALVITHDLGIVAQYCQRATILHGGEVLESADTRRLFDNPIHPYTQRLLSTARRRRSDPGSRESSPSWARGEGSRLVEVESDHWVRVEDAGRAIVSAGDDGR